MQPSYSFSLSLPARESIKAGLAMAITGGIAMGLGWSNPSWACIAVAVVSMPTVGESINKGLHRLLGTLLGGGLALLLVALFAQDRWAFVFGMSIILGYSIYRMTISRYVYVWFICGYISLFLASYVPDTSQQIFNLVTSRVQETALGVVVYSAVSTLLWPQKSALGLNNLVVKLLDTQKKALQGCFSMMRDCASSGSEALYGLEAQLVSQLWRVLDAAEVEQFEIYEVRGWWRQLISQTEQLMESLELWRESLSELPPDMPVEMVFINIDEFQAAIAESLDQSALLLQATSGDEPQRVDLTVDTRQLAMLSHHEQAVWNNVRYALERIETLVASLHITIQMLVSPPRSSIWEQPKKVSALSRPADADSLAGLARGFVGIWVAAFFWIYVDGPGHLFFVVFVGINILLGQLAPIQWAKFFVSESVGILLAGVLYVFVMPHLSGYFELSILLFTLTTVLYYIFWHPRMTMLKMASILPFLLLVSFRSQQQYDFAAFANSALSMLLALTFGALVSSFPFSQRPEKMCLRVVRRFFRQASRFLEQSTQPASNRKRDISASGLACMQISAGKAGRWAGSIDYELIPDNSSEQTAALVGSLNSIAYRFKMLADARAACPVFQDGFGKHVREWETVIGEAIDPWAHGRFEEVPAGILQDRLPELEAGLETTLAAVSEEAGVDTYAATSRLLGCYRGVYRALITHARICTGFNWNVWRESRF
ncbi:FUSC family protein [Maridesulfovibrio sp.]|uniref:FUSC family protein n=1 Tax=Maridesulfovibrio sp. TaxID=2795000 RepID=UPI002A18905C|nr:FUSC family protein [Maridesulfovibrio sp.]